MLTRVQMYNTRKLASGKWKVLEFTDWTGSCKYSSARSLGVLPLSNTSVLVFGGEKYMNKPSRGTAVVDLARRRFVPREKLVVKDIFVQSSQMIAREDGHFMILGKHMNYHCVNMCNLSWLCFREKEIGWGQL